MNANVLPAANDPPSPVLVMPGKALPAGAAMSWIGEGWKLFTRAPLMWIVMMVVLFIVAVVMAFIPIVGSLAWQILTPVIAGGLVLGCWSLENGGELEIEHLIAGFKRNFTQLLLVGVMYFVGALVILLVFAMFVGMSLLPALMMGNSDALGAIGAMSGGLLMATLAVTVLSVLLGAAVWFAPALVIMHDVQPVAAMKESFFAVFRNFFGALLFALVMIVLAVLAVIPFGLGMLVWFPLLIGASYRAYRQIFTE
jgi:uncharacterized membrane protein